MSSTSVSAVALTEELTVPTQLIIFDVSTTIKPSSTQNSSLNVKESELQSTLKKILVDEDNDNVLDFIRLKNIHATIIKKDEPFSKIYCQSIRSQFIRELNKCIEKRQAAYPNIGRMVIFFIGDSKSQDSLFLLSELPWDVGKTDFILSFYIN
jgi:hypothetical protein